MVNRHQGLRWVNVAAAPTVQQQGAGLLHRLPHLEPFNSPLLTLEFVKPLRSFNVI